MNNQNPKIRTLPEKFLTGKKVNMSFSNNKTSELWRSFMPERHNIKNVTGNDLYSLEVYPEGFSNEFNPEAEFEKWAAVEVKDHNFIPDGMEKLIVPQGEYAVFIHKGTASEGPRTYNYIFREWLPASEYQLDERPHLAIMGEKYKHASHDSEEEIWIPVREK